MASLHEDLIIEMFEVLTHNILFIRQVYPFGIFQKRRMYNCTVQRSRFPPLNEYITNALEAARFLHKAGQLHKFEIVLGELDGGTNKWESYFIEIATANVKNGGTAATTSVGAKRVLRADNAHADYERLVQFEEKMRATMLSLDGKCKNLNALPKDRLTFRIQLHTTRSGQAMLTDDVNLQVRLSSVLVSTAGACITVVLVGFPVDRPGG